MDIELYVSDNITNGELLKLVYPNLEISDNEYSKRYDRVHVKFVDEWVYIPLEWWNETYKKS